MLNQSWGVGILSVIRNENGPFATTLTLNFTFLELDRSRGCRVFVLSSRRNGRKRSTCEASFRNRWTTAMTNLPRSGAS